MTDAPIFGKLQVDQACGFLVISEFLNGHFSFEHDKAVLIWAFVAMLSVLL
ncbi:hypothetical protein HMPREF0542_11740 [Ligilactobacillus ruminis ATCC 25644]|uniref:Uncharacterized protein n=1 Tax=Ligilactobacillus ruminis ATCC 25644 TaxID=525362 RepID=E7FS63_9LACO|nr:hypothetical protein HMPREF0542_11740 [Ligilactobacillus ruminis ATCC 25644]EGX98479.1 hypothetical protein ANHS_941 [Ligilactobacillus ruminis ATCC 25644]